MLRLKNLSNKYQKRLIRPLYAQTQATPYACAIDDSLRNADGSLRIPVDADTTPINRGADVHKTKNSITSGLVAVRTKGEKITIGSDGNEQPFGLLANFVGGDLDDIGDENNVGVWRGPDSVFELLAPAFNDTGLAAAVAGALAGARVLLYSGADGRLEYVSSPGSRVPVAEVIDMPSASRIVVSLLV